MCSSDLLVSHTTVSDELKLAVAECGVDHRRLRDIVIHGFKRSFFPGSYLEKRAYVRKAIDAYDAVIREFAAREATDG